MELSSYEKHQGNLNAYYYVKTANMKAIYCIIPTIRYSEKSKTIKRDSKKKKKISDCQELREREKYVGRALRTFRTMKLGCLIL